VCKGSRQNRSVTSGKGLAPRVEIRDQLLKAWLRALEGLSASVDGFDGVQGLVGRGWKTVPQGAALGQLTTSLELFRTRGIRLFN